VYFTCIIYGYFYNTHLTNEPGYFQIYIHQHVSLREHLLSSTLDITSARMSDMGEYVCRASQKLVTRIKVDVLNGRPKYTNVLYFDRRHRQSYN